MGRGERWEGGSGREKVRGNEGDEQLGKMMRERKTSQDIKG